MKLTLCITTYNNAASLRKVAGSALRQTRFPDEVLIADDGSGEETASVVRSFALRAPFPVFHIWQEDRGFRAAKIRNKAITQSSGDYIILLDGDCVMNRHFIADHSGLAEKGCFIQGKRIHVNKKAVASFEPDDADSPFALLGMALARRISNSHHLIRLPYYPGLKNRKLKGIKSCNMSFFRTDILAVNGFNEDFEGWGNEDSELACRFFTYGLFKKVHPFMVVCFHLWHPTNKIVTHCNRLLLSAAESSGEYFCRNGLVKDLPDSEAAEG
ncbi:MAG: glycosyltransferase family 2 protein [Nitrospiraceae bacterium]|nr:glycosyltransferase family 2 protein [Nitrospiraceae bacterium]